jgi:hypothetical protein
MEFYPLGPFPPELLAIIASEPEVYCILSRVSKRVRSAIRPALRTLSQIPVSSWEILRSIQPESFSSPAFRSKLRDSDPITSTILITISPKSFNPIKIDTKSTGDRFIGEPTYYPIETFGKYLKDLIESGFEPELMIVYESLKLRNIPENIIPNYPLVEIHRIFDQRKKEILSFLERVREPLLNEAIIGSRFNRLVLDFLNILDPFEFQKAFYSISIQNISAPERYQKCRDILDQIESRNI